MACLVFKQGKQCTPLLASAYAGWAGSLPPEVVDGRLRQALQLADMPPDQFVHAVLPTMISA